MEWWGEGVAMRPQAPAEACGVLGHLGEKLPAFILKAVLGMF